MAYVELASLTKQSATAGVRVRISYECGMARAPMNIVKKESAQSGVNK